MHKNKVYVIAEIGINHNGLLQNCFRLIDAASDAGCNAVKFQFFRAKYLYPYSAGRLHWRNNNQCYSYNIYQACKTFEFPKIWLPKLMAYCRKRKIDFLSSVFDINGLRILVSYGMKQIKLSSYAVTNIPLIRKCASYNLPIILSTGAATLGEVEDAVSEVGKYHNHISLLHCSLKYPSNLSECNLGVIKTLSYAFPNNIIGYSDHSKEVSLVPEQAVYLGARIIEKHITLDKKMIGPDHFFALEPLELRRMVEDIRYAEKAAALGRYKINKKIFGSSSRIVYPHEKYLRKFCFGAIYAKRLIRKGQRIRVSDLIVLRPGNKARGFEPKYIDMFRAHNITASSFIGKEQPVVWSKILR